MPAGWDSGKGPSSELLTTQYPYMVEKEKGTFLASFYKGTKLIHEGST